MAELKVRVGVDGTGFQSGMNRINSIAQSSASKIGGALASRLGGAFAGGAAVSAISQFLGRIEEFTGKILANSDALGISTTFFQQWGFAASQANVRVRDADKGMAELTRRLGEGSEAFSKWGIATLDSGGNQLGAEAVLYNIADAMQKMESPAKRSAMAYDLFGKSGQKLLPVLKDGSTAMREMMGLAPIVSEDQIKAVDKLADSWARLKNNVASEGAQMIGTVARFVDEIGRMAGMTEKLSAVVEQGVIGGLFNNFFAGIPTVLKEVEKLLPKDIDGSPLPLPSGTQKVASVANKEKDEKESGFDFSTAKSPFSMTADSSTKIGGFIGGTTPGIINSILGAQQVTELKKANQTLSRVERILAAGGPIFSNDVADDGSL